MQRRIGAAIAAIAIAALAGLGWATRGKPAGAPPSEDSAAAAASEQVRVVNVAERSLDRAPALALTFSTPLGRDRRVDAFIKVTTAQGQPAAGAWVLGDNPRILYFPHVKPESTYEVRVLAGLPAANGTALADETSHTVTTRAVPPSFGFASRGTVLPAKASGGLPVATVNVPEVDVQFLRVKPAQLPRFLDLALDRRARGRDAGVEAESDDDRDFRDDWRYQRRKFQGGVPLYDLDRLHVLADSVYAGRFVTAGQPNRRTITQLPVEDIAELGAPGLYLAVMSEPGRFRYEHQVTWFSVSDIGLHVRTYGPALDVHASSLASGKPLREIEIQLADAHGKPLARATTDHNGLAAFPERPGAAVAVIARQREQLSLVSLREAALDLSEFDVSGVPYRPAQVFAYAGRDLYRPGEVFQLAALLRDPDGRPLPPQPLAATLKRPDGRSASSALWQPHAGLRGYYQRAISIPLDAPTGRWRLELRVDPGAKEPATVYEFNVEEFLPERLKLDLHAEAGWLGPLDELTVDVAGRYLYGAPAAENKLLAALNVQRDAMPLKDRLPGFRFGDDAAEPPPQREELPESQLDAAGRAQLRVTPLHDRPSSPMRVRLTLSLLESGGRPVVRSIERTLWPAEAMIGIRPQFDRDYVAEDALATFELVRAGPDARLRAAPQLEARLVREDRDYYWQFEPQRGWHYGYTEAEELVELRTVAIAEGGRAQLTLPVKWGRYRLEVHDPQSGLAAKYRFFAGWGAREDGPHAARPDRVQLKLDRLAYRDGDTARLTITPPHAGEALVTVEGDRRLWLARTAVPAGGAVISIPIDPAWRRHDLYVSVVVFRPAGEGDRVTPARAFGLAHLALEREVRRLKPVIAAPAQVRPDTDVKVKLSVPEAKGEAALVTLSAVDEGILNITQFATPDPFAFFFGKHAYRPESRDLYGRIVERLEGERGRLRFGGDKHLGERRNSAPKLRIVDVFSGPVALDANGEAEVTLRIPDFNGAVRLMAVAASGDRFGAAQAETTVAAPLVAELATPRFLAAGDTATLALDLHNLSGAPQSLSVQFKTTGPIAIRTPPRALALKDQEKATLPVEAIAEREFGLAQIEVIVAGEGLALARKFSVPVRPGYPADRRVRRYRLAPGATLALEADLVDGLMPKTVDAKIALSNVPPINIASALRGLLGYPYGCLEQTTSGAYPYVWVDAQAAKAFGLPALSVEERAQRIDAALQRIGSMQLPSGGFGLWSAASPEEVWLTPYVVGFLQDAREQGFAIPEAMYRSATDQLLRRLQAAAPASSPYGGRDGGEHLAFAANAYAGYILARDHRAPLGALRTLFEHRAQAKSGLPLVHLGIALQLMGDGERVGVAIAEGLGFVRAANAYYGDYGSVLRDAALAYALLERHGVEPTGRSALLAQIAGELGARRWLSTQERLALFLAGRDLTDHRGEPWTAELASGAQTTRLASEASEVRPLSRDELQGGTLRNTGLTPIYAEVEVQGYPSAPPAATSSPIGVTRTLYTMDGTPAAWRTLRVGELLVARLHIESAIAVADALVVDLIPAGLEVENLNLATGESLDRLHIAGVGVRAALQRERLKHQEYRDDRYVAALTLRGGHDLFYLVRVVTPGEFLVPPPFVEDMYRPEIRAFGHGGEHVSVADRTR